MTTEEAFEKAKLLAGPHPSPPTFRDIVPDDTGDLGGLGPDGKDTHVPPQPFQQDPNNQLLAANYQAELAAYNARLQMLFQSLLAEK